MSSSKIKNLLAQLLGGSMLLAAAFGASSVRATPIANGTALTNPAVEVDFTGAQNNVAINDAYAAQGITFSGLFGTSAFGNNSYPGSLAPAAVNYTDPNNPFPISINFASPVASAQFFLITDGYGTTITSLLDGVPVESETVLAQASDANHYFGFGSSAFNEITLAISHTGTGFIDNVQMGADAITMAVPEPGSVVLLLAGLTGLAVVFTRRPG